LREQGHEIGMRGEEIELRRERGAQTLQGAVTVEGNIGQRPLELGRATGEDGPEQPALRVEVVKQQLLVHPGAPGDLIHSRAVEAAAGKLRLRCRDDA
jgi:hypothetical protein